MRMVLQRLYIVEIFNLFDFALNLALRKVTCQMKVSAKFSVSTHIHLCILQSMSRLADQKRSWYLSIVKMTKYLSLVQQNINAISQLRKENEYHSVWTECIGLVGKSFL